MTALANAEAVHHAARLFLAATLGGTALAAVLLGALLLLDVAPSERTVVGLVRVSFGAAALGLVGVVTAWLAGGCAPLLVQVGRYVHVGSSGLDLDFTVDGRSIAMGSLVITLGALVGRFSETYLHREPGHTRFFMLLALSVFGMLVVAFGATYDQLFVGWELVGLASTFLVAFFHDRVGPVRSAQRVFITYRVADIALLSSVLAVHHTLHLRRYLEPGDPELAELTVLGAPAVTLIALGLVIGAMAKSAQLPLGAWLPRAMEGPTPSSAIFYGGLSVHAGIYLLVRSHALLDAAPFARAVMFVVGSYSFVYASQVVRVQVDAKGTLAHATMAQLSLMFVEIALGFPNVAFVHLIGHASLRTWQLLRAPSTFQDAAHVHAALVAAGDRPPMLSTPARVPALYRLAHGRFSLETLAERWIVIPLVTVGGALDRFERGLESRLTGDAPDDASTSVRRREGPGDAGSSTASREERSP